MHEKPHPKSFVLTTQYQKTKNKHLVNEINRANEPLDVYTSIA